MYGCSEAGDSVWLLCRQLTVMMSRNFRYCSLRSETDSMSSCISQCVEWNLAHSDSNLSRCYTNTYTVSVLTIYLHTHFYLYTCTYVLSCVSIIIRAVPISTLYDSASRSPYISECFLFLLFERPPTLYVLGLDGCLVG